MADPQTVETPSQESLNPENSSHNDSSKGFRAKVTESIISPLRSTNAQLQNSFRVFRRSLFLLWTSAPKETTYTAISILLQSVTPAIGIWIGKQIVDTVSAAAAQQSFPSHPAITAQTMGLLVLGWIGSQTIGSLLSPWDGMMRSNLSDKLSVRLHLMLMQKVNTFADISRFEDSKFYDELQVIQSESLYRPMELFWILTSSGRELFSTLAIAGLLLSLSWWIPLVMLAVTLPQSIISMRMSKRRWEVTWGKSSQSRRMRYYQTLMMTDTYAKEVRLFGLGDFLIERHQQAFEAFYPQVTQLRQEQALWSTGLEVLRAVGSAIAFLWVVFQAFQGRLSPGDVLLFVQSLRSIQSGLKSVVYSFSNLYDNLLYLRRLFEFLDGEPTFIVNSNPQSIPAPLQMGIRFDNVSFSYPDGRTAIADVSFVIKPGETVALVGENGAGKTTIVKLLTRLYDPTEGTIWVDDIDLKDLDLEAWRGQSAATFQDFGRYSFTLGENIALGDIQALENQILLERAGRQAGVNTLDRKLENGYATALGKQFDGTELSGGQWQKVALARAFFRENAQI
ncbi:MAG: ABC transporter ATP-binding protein, partial [Cyanobacteriota bacterium]|nr:ABC transporter ATP-binding protein [Cyanobacteriota bacterium]